MVIERQDKSDAVEKHSGRAGGYRQSGYHRGTGGIGHASSKRYHPLRHRQEDAIRTLDAGRVARTVLAVNIYLVLGIVRQSRKTADS